MSNDHTYDTGDPVNDGSQPPPEHGDRYDHRAAEDRAEDAAGPTIDAPVQPGAAELRAEAESAVAAGEVDEDPRDGGRSLAGDQEERQREG